MDKLKKVIKLISGLCIAAISGALVLTPPLTVIGVPALIISLGMTYDGLMKKDLKHIRASGGMDILIGGINWLVELCGGNTDFVAALPTALMKPLSGSGARGMMVDTMTTYGADSFAGRLACIFQGSTDTTFYILAVYFGSVGIRHTRHAVTCGLLADLAGILAAIAIAYFFFA